MSTFLQRVGISNSRGTSKPISYYRRQYASQGRAWSRLVLLLLLLAVASPYRRLVDLMANFGEADCLGASATSSTRDQKSLIAVSTQETIRYFSKHSSEYGNKDDFPAIQFLLRVACQQLDFNTVESVILIGGTNDGQSSRNVLALCPKVSLYGFEIQSKHYENTKKRLEALSNNVKVVNLGWDEYARSNVPIGGQGETGGLFDPQGQRGWQLQDSTVNTVALRNWTASNSIEQVFYLIIDTEGHEPKVIRGMGLDDVQNQRRFAMFQYELGGSWGERDSRHQNDPWSQFMAADHLAKNGYYLFLMGAKDFLWVEPGFFDENENKNFMKDEGYGRWVDGNLLAVHSRFSPSGLLEKIMERTPMRCSAGD